MTELYGVKQILEVSDSAMEVTTALQSLLTALSERLHNELGHDVAEFIRAATEQKTWVESTFLREMAMVSKGRHRHQKEGCRIHSSDQPVKFTPR